MKKIISLILAFIFVIGTLTLSSCDTDGDAQTTIARETTVRENPVPVDSLKGMNGKQLLERFFDDYKKAESLDARLNIASQGTVTENMVVKVDKSGDMSISVNMNSLHMNIWHVGGVSYVDFGKDKYKMNSGSVEAVFGDDLLDDVSDHLISKIYRGSKDYVYGKKLENAQIYSYSGGYYFSVSVPFAEVTHNVIGREAYVMTASFNADGEVTRIVEKGQKKTVMLQINSYGKEVEVVPPQNPDDFAARTNISDIGYLIYENTCKILRTASIYRMAVTVDDKLYIRYLTNGYRDSINVSNKYTLWRIEGKGYYSDGGAATEMLMTDEKFKSFDKVAPLKNFITTAISENQMKSFRFISTTVATKIYFTVEYAPGESRTFEVAIEDDFQSISYKMIVEENYKIKQTDRYYFSEINNNNIVINPIS